MSPRGLVRGPVILPKPALGRSPLMPAPHPANANPQGLRQPLAGMTEVFGEKEFIRPALVANEGLRFNQFHTTALPPTRTALLSGRNHHMNNIGTASSVPKNTHA